ncbi:acyl-CoA dehydrogenase [Desulfatirhabdium butyrativorans]|uniref:acyl-CoA dehydrogenase n=1 Tax=Desulfatirhabdium butyrativorans TaxID=340467 RepID=UPI0004017451|nr:acyl-CoA dehydrogenase [Desulfatirhabdium butyrativorans]
MNFDFTAEERSRLEALDEILAGWASSMEFETRSPIPAVRDRALSAVRSLQSLPYVDAGRQDTPLSRACLMTCSQKLAAYSPSLHLTIDMGIRLPVGLIQAVGADAVSDKCAELLEGKRLAAVAFRESTMNVVNDALTTRAQADGTDWVIHGTKSWVVNAPIADDLLVAAAVDDGYGLFWVAADAPGVSIGEPLQALGFEGAAIAHVTFDGCRIPPSHQMGRFDRRVLMGRLQDIENEILIASAIGLMKAAFEEAKNHAKTHRSGGKPIIAYQEVGFKLSEMLTQLQTAELLAYRTAWSIEKGAEDVESLLLCAKVFCAEAAEIVTGAALQILSGRGYFGQSVSERAYRCAKFTQIAGTSTEIARVRIGDEALGYR